MSKFLRMLLLASALAIPVTAIQIARFDQTVEAAGKKKIKKATKGKKLAKKVKAKKVAKKATVVASKSCGTYKYRKGGKCLDARDKKS